jgi:response regulator RpfG family c-di-GMP phosphodiesterase
MDGFIPNRHLLYVDDEPGLLSAFTSLMRKTKYDVTVLQESEKIEEVLHDKGPFAVVFSDQRMPGLDGVGVLGAVARIHPGSIRVLVTGYSDQSDTQRAINIGGISHYINKPWEDEKLVALATQMVEKYNLLEENKFLTEGLKTANRELQTLLDGTVAGIVRLLGDLVGYINEEAAAKTMRIRALGMANLAVLGSLTAKEKWEITCALDLCHLGIAGIPLWIQLSLSKAGLGAIERFPSAANHNLLAAGLLKDIPGFEQVARIISLQEKNFDGSGSPENESVKAMDLPLGARLLHILLGLEREITTNFTTRELLKRMVHLPKLYDVHLVTSLLAYQEMLKTSGKVALVAPVDLKPGMIIVDDVLTRDKVNILRSGSLVTETALRFLKVWICLDRIAGRVKVRLHI